MSKYPQQAFPAIGNPECDQYIEGMTLRDYFAAQAIAGMLANAEITKSFAQGPCAGQPRHAWFAESSYQMADALLAEKER